jgi:hypothetical protein
VSDDISAMDGEYNYYHDSFDLEVILIPKKEGTFFYAKLMVLDPRITKFKILKGIAKAL